MYQSQDSNLLSLLQSLCSVVSLTKLLAEVCWVPSLGMLAALGSQEEAVGPALTWPPGPPTGAADWRSGGHIPGIPMAWSGQNNTAPQAHQGPDLSLSSTQGLCLDFACNLPSLSY